MAKLFKITNSNDENEKWYFTNLTLLSRYIGATRPAALSVVKGMCKRCKGWYVEEVNDDTVLSKYINPERDE